MLNTTDLMIINKIKAVLTPTGMIEKIILFGSRAYGNAFSEQSDYDILLISAELYDWQKQDYIYDLLYDIQLEYNIILDVHFLAKSELNSIRAKQPIFQKALTEGICA